MLVITHSINKIEYIYNVTLLFGKKLVQVEFFDRGSSEYLSRAEIEP